MNSDQSSTSLPLNKLQNPKVNSLLIGSAAGVLATLPMTAVMMGVRYAATNRARPILPDKVSEGALTKINPLPIKTKPTEPGVWAAHFLFGGLMSLLFLPLANSLRKYPLWMRGSILGLNVWAANYAGALPLFGIRPPPQRTRALYNVMGITSHLVWGLAAAAFLDIAARSKNENS